MVASRNTFNFLGFLYSVAMDMLLSILCRVLINQIIYPQIAPLARRSLRLREQIYTDLNNFKLILEYLFLRNLRNL